MDRIIEEHILPRSEVVCPQLHLTQAPISIRVVSPLGDPETVITLPQDNTGYLFFGPDDICDTGRVSIAPDLHGVLGQGEELQIYYCTDDPIPSG